MAFVAIVWAVAGSYVAFEMASSGATSLMVSHADRFGDIILSHATKRSTACVVAPGERATETEERATASQAHAAAWLLGIHVGRDAVLRQSSVANQPVLEPRITQMSRLAEALKVPAPVVFVPRQSANAHREFIEFVEDDGRQTAHQLAVRYAPRDCEIYKLGAFWGYSAAMGAILPDRQATYDAEIRHYARRSGLPEELWRPMVDTPGSGQVSERVARAETVTAAITKHLTAASARAE